MVDNGFEFHRQFLTVEQRTQCSLGLAIAIAPIIGGAILNFGVHIPFLGCPLMRYAGIPCPGWGLTRSVMAAMRGDLHQAIAYHLFGPLILIGFIIAAIHFSLELIRDRKLNSFYIRWVTNPKIQIFSFLILLGYHAVRLQKLWLVGELYPSFLHSPLGHLIWG
ncbi:MAG: DUF2752 domain-containing protein [Limnospira sp.]